MGACRIFLRATTYIFIHITIQSVTWKSYKWNVQVERKMISIIMNMGVPKDEDHGHMGDNFSACNDRYEALFRWLGNHLAKFHAPLSGRTQDMDDDRTCVDTLMKFMDNGFKSMDTWGIFILRANTMISIRMTLQSITWQSFTYLHRADLEIRTMTKY